METPQGGEILSDRRTLVAVTVIATEKPAWRGACSSLHHAGGLCGFLPLSGDGGSVTDYFIIVDVIIMVNDR